MEKILRRLDVLEKRNVHYKHLEKRIENIESFLMRKSSTLGEVLSVPKKKQVSKND